MPRLIRTLLLALTLVLPGLSATAEDSRKVFVFGNSLIHHLTDSDETTVPYWLGQMAAAQGHALALDGTWGFPADFARTLPPEPQWSFAGVTRAMDSPRGFRMAGFDTILLSPPNFVQYAPPDADTLDGSMRDLIGRTFDWASNQTDARFLLYEGWAEMGQFDSFPPSNRAWRRYHAFNVEDHAAWYDGFLADLRADFPDLAIDLVPVARVISALVAEGGPLEGLTAEDLYSDDAPHGTATTYLLAAMVTHAVLWGEAPPVIGLPDTIHPLVRDSYADLSARIWQDVAGAAAPDGASLTPPETGWDNPSLAFGLTGIEDWSTQMPFLDLMKTARPWIGHLPGQWGGVTFDDLLAGGHLDAQGWPVSLPAGVSHIETLVLTDQPAASAPALAGRYVLRWQGSGDLTVGGLAQDIDAGANEIRFSYTPGDGLVSIAIAATDPVDPIRSITLVREDRLDLFAAGAVFNPDWLAVIGDARMVRFMDWMRTNGSPQVTWDDRPQRDDFSWVWRGVPVEVMVDLANRIGADPWFTLPHMADDAHVRAMAEIVRDRLDPRLIAHVEWSNEVWNFVFPQAVWAQEQAAARWGSAAGDDAWMQFAGTRAAEVADIWTDVFAGQEGRLVRVVATHTGWPGLEEPLLDAPLRVAEGLPPPVESFDAYAVTGYFGLEIGEEDFAPRLRDWIAAGTAAAEVTEALRDGSFGELIDDIWPHQAGVAADRGLQLLMYEGGTHVTGLGAVTEDDTLTAFFTAYNYGPEMAGLYNDLLAAWRDLGGGPFNAFVDMGRPSRWGSWGALRHLDDMNPRWATLVAWNSLPPEAAARAPGTFAHGLFRQGTDGAELIEGTAEEDTMLGRGGDDILVTAGGADILHGGDGRDRAVLPGTAADWAPMVDGATLVMIGPAGEEVRLTGVEEVTFTDDPATVLTFADPAADQG